MYIRFLLFPVVKEFALHEKKRHFQVTLMWFYRIQTHGLLRSKPKVTRFIWFYGKWSLQCCRGPAKVKCSIRCHRGLQMCNRELPKGVGMRDWVQWQWQILDKIRLGSLKLNVNSLNRKKRWPILFTYCMYSCSCDVAHFLPLFVV